MNVLSLFSGIENVPNLVRTGLRDVLIDLADLGFDAWWGRVPAAAVGAPHLRWRLFVIATDPGRVELRHQPGWERGPDREGPPVIGHDGAAWALADANGQRGRLRAGLREDGTGAAQPARVGIAKPADRGATLADSSGEGLEGPRQLHDPGSAGRPGLDAANGGWWATEPDLGRVAHGVPARVDRLRSLGNAVVPQVSEYIGRLVMAAAEGVSA